MLLRTKQPIVAIATAPGRGAVGIVRISGPDTRALAEVVCGRALQPRKATYLMFTDALGQAIDHGLAIHFPAPHSYTGEDVLELQAHGGQIVLQLLLARCLEAGGALHPQTGLPRLPGIRVAQPGEFTERAFLNGKLDLAQAEAVADLIDASTEAAARGAGRSLSGAFSREIHGLRDKLIQLRMLVEATLDFPEEEIDFLSSSDAGGQLSNLKQTLAQVMERSRQGVLLREGMRVVIAGQPNAGKSSLLNALAGAELAIVTPIAGTTRDKVVQTIQIQGVPVHVVDTAGLRLSDDEIEKIGIERAWAEISTADVVLFLHDLTRMGTPAYDDSDAQIAQALSLRLSRGIPVIDVWNKYDAVPEPAIPATSDQGLVLSAKTGDGLPALRARLLQAVGWQAGAEGVYIARERHLNALGRVRAHFECAQDQLQANTPALDLLAEELRLAQGALNEITGEFSSEDLLGVIFSRFCIGK